MWGRVLSAVMAAPILFPTAARADEPWTTAGVAEAVRRLADARPRDDLRVTRNGGPASRPIEARLTTVPDRHERSAVGGARARDARYVRATAHAVSAWPDLKKGFATRPGFDADATGELYFLTTRNLMGTRYQPGSYPFACTIDGQVIAAKFDATVAGGVEAVQARLGRDLGDRDADGAWEIIVRVEGTTARLADLRGGDDESVEAAVVTIVAAHCGPLAAATGKGMVTETGETVPVSSSNPRLVAGLESTTHRYFGSAVRLVIGLAVSFVALLLAGFRPLAPLSSRFEGYTPAFGIVGGLAVVFGLSGLFAGSSQGVFASACLTATGVVVSALVLNRAGVWKAGHVRRVIVAGVPLGSACTGTTVVSLLTQGRLWVI